MQAPSSGKRTFAIARLPAQLDRQQRLLIAHPPNIEEQTWCLYQKENRNLECLQPISSICPKVFIMSIASEITRRDLCVTWLCDSYTKAEFVSSGGQCHLFFAQIGHLSWPITSVSHRPEINSETVIVWTC